MRVLRKRLKRLRKSNKLIKSSGGVSSKSAKSKNPTNLKWKKSSLYYYHRQGNVLGGFLYYYRFLFSGLRVIRHRKFMKCYMSRYNVILGICMGAVTSINDGGVNQLREKIKEYNIGSDIIIVENIANDTIFFNLGGTRIGRSSSTVPYCVYIAFLNSSDATLLKLILPEYFL